MPRYDERLELAPRDVVARSIQAEMLGRGDSHALLDISHKPPAEVLAHFPNIAAHCGRLGLDITKVRFPSAGTGGLVRGASGWSFCWLRYLPLEGFQALAPAPA